MKISKLAKLREERGYSQADLAHVAGLSLRTLQNYEQGVNNINGAKLRTLCKIAGALRCPLVDIIEPDEVIENYFENIKNRG